MLNSTQNTQTPTVTSQSDSQIARSNVSYCCYVLTLYDVFYLGGATSYYLASIYRKWRGPGSFIFQAGCHVLQGAMVWPWLWCFTLCIRDDLP